MIAHCYGRLEGNLVSDLRFEYEWEVYERVIVNGGGMTPRFLTLIMGDSPFAVPCVQCGWAQYDPHAVPTLRRCTLFIGHAGDCHLS